MKVVAAKLPVFAHGSSLPGMHEPARRGHSPTRANSAAGAGETRRHSKGFAARHPTTEEAALRRGAPQPTPSYGRLFPEPDAVQGPSPRPGHTHQDAHHVGPQLGERLRRAALRRGGGAAGLLPLHTPARSPDQRRLPAAASPPRPAMPPPPRSRPAPGHRGQSQRRLPPLKLSVQRQGGQSPGGATAARRGRPPGGGGKPLLPPPLPPPPDGPAPPPTRGLARRTWPPGGGNKRSRRGPGPRRLPPAQKARAKAAPPPEGAVPGGGRLVADRTSPRAGASPACRELRRQSQQRFLHTAGRSPGKRCQLRSLWGRRGKRRPVNSGF